MGQAVAFRGELTDDDIRRVLEVLSVRLNGKQLGDVLERINRQHALTQPFPLADVRRQLIAMGIVKE